MRSIPSGDAPAALAGALDVLGDEDLSCLVGPAVLERLRVLLPLANRLSAEVARTVRRGEVTGAAECDGAKTMAAWLRGHARLAPSAAGQLVRVGRTLEQLPAVAAAAAAGEITADHVAVIAPVVAPANVAAAEAQGAELAAIDATLAGVAAAAPFLDLATAVHHYLERLDPDGPEPDPTEARFLSMTKHADGSLGGRFHLDAVGGEKVQAAIESIVQANRPAGDSRSRIQRQADALVQLCDNLLASGTLPFQRTAKPHLLITMGLADLVEPGKGPSAAKAAFGATLSAARARWASCDPEITRIVLGPDGQPLDVGRRPRCRGPRRACEAWGAAGSFDCVFAGCSAPTWWCDGHHLLEWALGGQTTLENSGLLCECHHTKVHHGYRVERDSTGRWHTYRPDGSEILVLARSPDPSEPLAPTG